MLADNAEFDFIVSGAGSAGCAVAARLSESGRYSVLLLEAGPRDTNPWIHIPLGFTKLFTDERVNWKFETEPVEALDGRRLFQPRGRVLGGSSSINGTVYMRGQPRDYDGWRQRGLEGWDWDSVLPFFVKAEDNERGGDALHGAGGPLRVSDVPTEWDLPRAMVAAAVEAGIPANPDFNGPEQEGTGFYQFTASRKRRWSSAKAYLAPAQAAAQPACRDLRPGAPPADRGRPRVGHRIPDAGRASAGAGQARDRRVRRRFRVSAPAPALGHRPGGASQRHGHPAGAGPAGRRRPSSGTISTPISASAAPGRSR